MRLTDEQIDKLKNRIRELGNIPLKLQYDILHAIEALQHENEVIKTAHKALCEQCEIQTQMLNMRDEALRKKG